MINHRKPFVSGFSLVELLVVMGIVVGLLTLSGPAMKLLLSSSTSDNAAEDLSLAVEWARAEAVGKSNYVWLRLGDPSTDALSEASDLELRLWASKDGSDNGSPDNLEELRKAERYESMTLATDVRQELIERPTVEESAKMERNGWLIFSPDGSVRMVASDSSSAPPNSAAPSLPTGLERWIELGLQPTQAGIVTETNRKRATVLQVAGLTGHPIIYR